MARWPDLTRSIGSRAFWPCAPATASVPITIFRPGVLSAATNITSFATWQGFGASDQYVGTNDRTICSGGTCTHTVADADALIAALFQGTPSATGTDPAVYKPATGGPLDGTGNTLCIGGGSAVHIGAYETGNETIGPPLSAAAATSTRPRPRRGYLLH